MTHLGAVLFTDITGELVEDALAKRFYPDVSAAGATLVWATWRKPTHDELVEAWPARWAADTRDLARGWRQPTIEELRIERRKGYPPNEPWRPVGRRWKDDRPLPESTAPAGMRTPA